MSGQGTKMVLYWISIFPFCKGWFGAESSPESTLQDPITGRALEQQEEQRKEGRLHLAVDAAFLVPVLPRVKAAAGAS